MKPHLSFSCQNGDGRDAERSTLHYRTMENGPRKECPTAKANCRQRGKRGWGTKADGQIRHCGKVRKGKDSDRRTSGERGILWEMDADDLSVVGIMEIVCDSGFALEVLKY